MTNGGASRMVRPCVSLREHPAAEQRLAHGAAVGERRVHVEARPQASAPHLGEPVSDERVEPSAQPRAELRRLDLVLTGSDHRDDLTADRARERVAAERASVRSGPRRPSTSRSPSTAESGTIPPPSALPRR